jgi:hypothetical protein
MVDPPMSAGYPPFMDPPAQPDPGAALDDLLTRVPRLTGPFIPPCAPPDQPDTWQIDMADVAFPLPCNVAAAPNVGSPGSVGVADQTQYAPVPQTAGAN